MIRLAISNIAWAPAERDAALALIAANGAQGLEIAPGLAFPGEADAFEPSAAAVHAFRDALDRHCLELVSMQSLLFGVADARLFGTPSEQQRFEAGIARAVRLAARLGIGNIVLGSPGNRVIPADMPAETAAAIAAATFRRLGDLCAAGDVSLALEPNPAAYGTNFMTSVADTLAIVRRCDHQAVTLNFDLGSLHMNGEAGQAAELFESMRPHVSHVHISEPQLAPVPADPVWLAATLAAIDASGFDRWCSIEMRAPGGDNLAAAGSAVAACAAAMPSRAQAPTR